MVDSEQQVMTVREVSEYLRIAESTVYKLVQEGEIPGKKIGGIWRFSRKLLDDWLEGTHDEFVHTNAGNAEDSSGK